MTFNLGFIKIECYGLSFFIRLFWLIHLIVYIAPNYGHNECRILTKNQTISLSLIIKQFYLFLTLGFTK